MTTCGRAVIRRFAEQPVAHSPRAKTRYVALGKQTERDFGLFDYVMPPTTPGASPHYHRGFSETFYILDGELDVLNGGDWVKAGPGDLVYVPKESVHGFRNSTESEVRFLILFTPGVAREDYFAANAARRAAGITLSESEQDAFAALHDQYNVH